ncbi:hypothetical protein PoB_007066400 [Plakobranchus ocellatus]|uniref:Uncharacterized protein n=1 Tax=Plakobranchus ocellatus TaxID=259542 RepID=A0AAV4DJF0_9GAST|nr:hypothetical protein PoB_007066400 [Plakobranchus ocellatus]
MIFIFPTVSGLARGVCPSDLSTEARDCFSTYNVKAQSMQRSPLKLCCGVDVETLRAFCHSYIKGMRCVHILRSSCPAENHYMIDNGLVDLRGAEKALNSLCVNDSIIEQYAQYQGCLTYAGSGSEACFATHLLDNRDATDNIRFLSTVNTDNMDEFCRKMKATVTCVQSNVRRVCGQGRQQAVKLASILVKLMVRHSTDCDYEVDIRHPQHNPREPYQSNPAYISDDHVGDGSSSNSKHGRSGGGSGSGSWTSNTKKRQGSEKENFATNLRPSTLSAFFITSLLLFLQYSRL